MGALTVRQQQFIREYLIDGNGTRAAIRAGYSPNSAHGMASHLLKQPDVRQALDSHRARLLRERDITADRVLEEYRRLAFSDIRGLFNPDGSFRSPSDWDDETAAAVAGLEVSKLTVSTNEGQLTQERILKVKRWDKVKALEVLAKYTGVLRDGTSALGARTHDTAPIDPTRIARMDDTELDAALALIRKMDASEP